MTSILVIGVGLGLGESALLAALLTNAPACRKIEATIDSEESMRMDWS